MRFAVPIFFWVAVAVPLPAPQSAFLAYLGGSGTDDCDGVALDGASNLYFACHSDSADFPHLPAKSGSEARGGMDAVIVKVAARTGRVVWATRVGGRSWDGAGAVKVTREGSVYVLGATRSTDFPTTPDAVQRRFGGPDRDVFLLKLDSQGKIVYSTFLGGSKNDEATGLCVAPNGTVFVGGVTMSADFPGYRAAEFGPRGRPDGFVARLKPGNPSSLQTVLLGGTGVDHISALALDRTGNLFAAGFTASADFPVKAAAQPRFGGSIDSFLVKLAPSDWNLIWSTWLGGSKMDGAYSVALDGSDNPVVSGVTESGDFPSTRNAFQPRRRGPIDAFVGKMASDGSRILWSTYYGGSKTNSDQFLGGSVGVGGTGVVWLTGMTSSSDLPTRNALQPVNGGGDFDGFLAAFSSDGSKLCYGSYLGGNAHDVLEGLAIDRGTIYASGLTSSNNLQVKRSPIQQRYGGGPYDAVIIGLDASRGQNCH